MGKQGDLEARASIDAIAESFFDLFDNRGGRPPRLDMLHELVVPGATIVRATEPEPELTNVADFLAPRQKMLSDGTLAEFAERELAATTEVFGNVAQRFSLYEKSGIRDGRQFTTRGMKAFQFVRTPDGWRISAVAWDDER
ncbi:MAG TPA: hypothetical protein VF139_06985 [Candidatus Polarisedimenticolaceae bacterium]